MIQKLIFYSICLILVSCGQEVTEEEHSGEIQWQKLDQSAFDTAEEENKLVLLEVGANWCHWCHVMDDSTYSDLEVQDYLNENFILCREDQDARPDLYAAYRQWGWPAIIVFNPDGQELLKLRGYQPKKSFITDLKTVRSNPIPIIQDSSTETVNKGFTISEEKTFGQFMKNLDHEKGGYTWRNKSIQLPGIKHAMQYASNNDSLKNWLDKTITNSYSLVDPVWSGVYQYSARSSWDHQHFEKLLRVHSAYIESYALYGKNYSNTKAIETAEGIVGYCDRFLSNETPLYWNSQNADLISGVHSASYYALNEEDRLAQGIPSIDETIYLKENAGMIAALAKLWAASDNPIYLEKGSAMLDYILENFKSSKGIYCREEGNESIIAFEDNRRLLDALITYYQISSNSNYLKAAEDLGKNIIAHFDSPAGIRSAVGDLALSPVVVPLNNIEAVLTFNLLGHLVKNNVFIDFAQSTYDKMDKKKLTASQATLPFVFRANREIQKEPFHALFISDGSNSALKKTYAQRFSTNPDPYFIFEELVIGNMSAEDEAFYGSFDAGTLFMCTSSYCSAPIYNLSELEMFFLEQTR